MILKLLRDLSDEYDDDMICQEAEVAATVYSVVREEFIRRMGREPRTDYGEAALAGRADLMYHVLQELGVIETLDEQNRRVRVYASRARSLIEHVEGWKLEV